MRVFNSVYVSTTGRDPEKFVSIPAFEQKTGKKLYKCIARDFRMAGKIGDFICKNAIELVEDQWDYNRYGPQRMSRKYLISSKDAKVLMEMFEKRDDNPKPKPTLDDTKAAWCRRMVKLTGISMKRAEEIADEKLGAKWGKIKELENKQFAQHFSVRRQALINNLRRKNPLRRIKDKEHAMAILTASARHCFSDYEFLLDTAKEMAEYGEIDYSEVQRYARDRMNFDGDLSYFFEEDEEEKEEGIADNASEE